MNFKCKQYLILISTLLLLSGCFPAFVGGTALVGSSIAEERTAGDQVDDNLIMVKIKDQFAQYDIAQVFERVSVTVIEGRVMLTGSVTNHKYQEKAGELAWKVKGVKEVINEIEISDKKFVDHAKDAWISSAIRSKLLIEEGVRSLNFAVDTNAQVVYLIGIAQDEEELDKVVAIASKIKGVKRVVSHITLKNDPRRTINR